VLDGVLTQAQISLYLRNHGFKVAC
ncbi:hypothetical protein A2U01_0113283, partial [Trifolium medium]|nr:hypothetical protein [Trifolium medium]